jgi:putative ABC transport system permease protein
VFVVVELALASVLLMFAARVGESLKTLWHLDLGLDEGGVLTSVVERPRSGVGQQPGEYVYTELVLGLQARPELAGAAWTSIVPLSGARSTTSLALEGHDVRAGDRMPTVEYSIVSPGFFETLGIPVLFGRRLTREDGEGTPRAVVVNRAFVERFWPDRDPLGLSVAKGGPAGGWRGEVVGIVGDVRYRLEEDPVAHLYWFESASSRPNIHLVVRGEDDSLPSAAWLQREVRLWRGGARIYGFQSMVDRRSDWLSDRIFVAALLGLFTLVALILAGAGTYGALSYWISRHRHELGVRIAVGAPRSAVASLVLTRAALLVVLGLVLGTAFTGLLHWALGRFVPGLPAEGGTSYVLGLVSLGFVGLLATALPFLRVWRIQPASVLRSL